MAETPKKINNITLYFIRYILEKYWYQLNGPYGIDYLAWKFLRECFRGVCVCEEATYFIVENKNLYEYISLLNN